RPRQRWASIEQFQGALELVERYLTLAVDFNQYADHLAPTEGHAQANAWLQGAARYAGAGEVVEQTAQRRGQGKAQNKLGQARSCFARPAILARLDRRLAQLASIDASGKMRCLFLSGG